MKKPVQYAILAIVVLLVLIGRVFYQSRNAYLEAEALEKAGKYQESIMQFDQSAHGYFPGNPFVGRSLQKLWEIGQKLEQKEPNLSLWAYDSMRGSIYAVRSVYLPHAFWLEKVNARIAELRTAEELRSVPTKNLSEVLAFHQAKLNIDQGPNLGWSLILELGFFGWIISVVGFIWKGFDSRGVMYPRPSVPWIFGIILSFGIWIIGLIKA